MRLRDSDVVFVIDEDVGATIAAGVTLAGGRIVLLTDRVPRGTKDVDWLPRACGWGHAIITRDVSMRFKSDERDQLASCGCHVFILRCGGMALDDIQAIVKARTKRMVRHVVKYPTPFLALVTPSGIDIKVGGETTRSGSKKD